MLHAVFLGILIISVAARIVNGDPIKTLDNLDAPVVRVALAHGFELATEAKSESLSTYFFNAPDCEQPVLVTPVHVTLEEESLLPAVQPGYMVRYNYFDQVWDTPSRFWAFVELKKIKALALIGLAPYLASEWMLRVATPGGCASAEGMDWRAVWTGSASMRSLTRGKSAQ